ncbi:cobalamin B12-binding domain-containing protein [Bradyrhizobium canariense]|uniref:cobalamin B12-binding domain-containing protein n=1 Tax=Bradyrhizobium canariense TaxID=255045 RepID=UPI0018E9A145|nr:cobalamin B12-binding domain-containing protein [Bradyrhizobium canariense]
MTGGGAIESDLDLDLVLVNSPLKDYDQSVRRNDFTLPTLGLAYIATCANQNGFSVRVLDAEARGLGLSEVAAMLNEARPRWVGLNLLAPTYAHSVHLLQLLDPSISVMLGGHQAKAMPRAILEDSRIPRIDALVLGEAETRVPILLTDVNTRVELPSVFWRDGGKPMMPVVRSKNPFLLAPTSMPCRCWTEAIWTRILTGTAEFLNPRWSPRADAPLIVRFAVQP